MDDNIVNDSYRIAGGRAILMQRRAIMTGQKILIAAKWEKMMEEIVGSVRVNSIIVAHHMGMDS
jgi:hypothetical protein